MNDASPVVVRTTEYLSVPAVVGYESPFLTHLAGELAAIGRAVTRHPGVVVAPGSARWCVSAHADRHGLVAVGGGRFAYAAHEVRRTRYGESVVPRTAARDAICGRLADERVYAYDAASGESLGEGTLPHDAFCGREDGTFVVDGLDTVSEGTPAAFEHRCHAEDGLFRGQIDNCISVAIAMELLARGFEGTVLFTAEEEIGRSWRHLLAALPGGAPLVVLDTSPFDSPAEAEAGAVVLRERDSHGDFAPELVARFARTAKDLGVPIVYKDRGSTELGRLAEATGGTVTGATVQLPTFDYHTNHESTTVAAIANVVDVLTAGVIGGE